MLHYTVPPADVAHSMQCIRNLLLDLPRYLGNGLEQISNETVVSHLEDGRLGIGVDSYNCLAVLHAREVLNGSADADGNVEVRRNDLTRLSNLHVVRHIPGIHRRTRGPNCRVELVR